MAVLDLVACPICRARDSLVRQTTQLESRTHVTYECQQCGTLLVWLGDEMWLEADRWSFQKVGLPEWDDLLYRSMTAAELRKLAGEKPPYKAPPGRELGQASPPPVWIEMSPADELPLEEPWPGKFDVEAPVEEPQLAKVEGVTVAAEAPPEAEEAETLQEAPPEASVGATVLGEAAPSQKEAVAEPEPPPPPEVVAEPVAVRPAVQPAEVAREAPQEPVPEAPSEAGAEGTADEPGPPAGVAEEPTVVGPVVQQAEVRQAAVEPVRQAEAATARPAPGAAAEPEQPPVRSTRPRRRGRGSPFLVISVGLVLLCLICGAAAMVIYSMWERLPPGAEPTANPPASEVQPSETPVPTDTPFPTATPLPVPSEIPAEPEGGVEFQGVTDYLSSSGSHYLVGEVLNGTADTLRFVEVLAIFYDANGQLVGTGSTFTELSIIEPGSTAPFKMATLDPPDVGHYDLRVDYLTTTQSPIRLELMGHTGGMADDGWYYVTGEVRNPHGFTIKFPEIVATYYNGAHEVVRVEWDRAEVDPLEPGQSSAFEVVLTEPPADLMHYNLQTEAVQQ